VVACCVQEWPAFLAFYAGIISLLVLGTMREVEVLVLQSYLVCIEVLFVTRKWVSSGFVFVLAGDTMCISFCYLRC
jgi:hypothetical protein